VACSSNTLHPKGTRIAIGDALGLTDTGADTLADARTGKNGVGLAGLLRQSVFGRLAGYELLCRSNSGEFN